MAKPTPLPDRLKPWADARRRFRLSHAHVQMARELGLNPSKFGGLANHRQEPWKVPLPDFIAKLYLKRFGKTVPDTVRTLEEIAAVKKKTKPVGNVPKAASPEPPPAVDQ